MHTEESLSTPLADNCDGFEWAELRNINGCFVLFSVVAEPTPEGWKFWDREAWEVNYQPVAEDSSLLEIVKHGQALLDAKFREVGVTENTAEHKRFHPRLIPLARELKLGDDSPDTLKDRSRHNRKFIAHLKARCNPPKEPASE
jgi:hypothetical protein